VSVGSSHFNARVTGVVVSDGSDDFVAPDTWYRRWDNNGWRLVTSTASEGGGALDEIRCKPAAPHHFSRTRRVVDAEAARKRRKREWLMKMYKEGLARERDPLPRDDPDAPEDDSECE
jgi:hypothetical protein